MHTPRPAGVNEDPPRAGLHAPARPPNLSFMPAERVLAVDPSLRGTGYAVLETSAGKLRALAYGVVKNPPKLAAHRCLREIHDTLARIADEHRPTTFAIEGVIYVQNVRTAIILGSARGAALLVAASHDLEVHEYAPRLVKQAVVGRGGAQKDQVAFMIRALLGLKETPPSDAADALAIGLTHFNRRATAIR
jgi:crossover junction endodeoxyribonuclease RuvC